MLSLMIASDFILLMGFSKKDNKEVRVLLIEDHAMYLTFMDLSWNLVI